jgi:hypothetical protein
MAKYNYWEAGGSPTGYSPLLAGWNNRASLGVGEFIVRFKAKSPTSARLNVQSADGTTFKVEGVSIKTTTLTPSMASYEFGIVCTKEQFMYFYAPDGIGSSPTDIVIEDIQLVEKPLGRATINGIDGFRSGKWTLHANAKVIDDETLELNATSAWQGSTLSFAVEPGTQYTMTLEGGNYATIDSKSAANAQLQRHWDGGFANRNLTFTTHADARILLINLTTGLAGKHTFKRPMLNIGPVPVSYEPKRGERMVPPQTAGKNLLNPLAFESGSIGGSKENLVSTNRLRDIIRLVKDRTYTVSTNNSAFKVYVRKFNDSSNTQTGYHDWAQSTTFVANDEVAILVAKNDESAINLSELPPIQLEEGSVTPYEPYRVRTTRKRTGPIRKATKYPGGKNLFDGVLEIGMIAGATGQSAYNSTTVRTPDYIPVKASTQYSISMLRYVFFYDINKNYLNPYTGPADNSAFTFTTPTNCAYIRLVLNTVSADAQIQLEEGLPTSFEPYRPRNRLATKYPKKNLFKGFTKSVFTGSGFAGSEIISDRELIHNPNAQPKVFSTEIDVEPNTFYSLSFISESATLNNGQIAIFNEDTSVQIYTYSPIPFKFNTGNRTKIRVYFRNGAAIEPVKFKDVQLERGEIQTSYEPYKGVLRQARR